ncbi:jg19653, partial [Pararge aegeria aegeria]
MPKRSHKNDSDYLRRKLRKIEKKLAKRDKRLHDNASSYSSSISADESPVPVLLDSDE